MLQSKNEWIFKAIDEEGAKELAEAIHIPLPISRLLIQRGYTTAESAHYFLHNQKEHSHDPMLLDGMSLVKDRLLKGIANKEKILVFGDYDADGVSSTVLMVKGLREQGAEVSYYIPDRFSEGYGPNVPALQLAKDNGIDLVITVDTGISAVEEAAFAKEIGLDYIVTDHHEPPPVLPDAYAIINPKKPGCQYPFKSLAGVGVALKVIQALSTSLNADYLALAAIGTIADLVPLIDENRWISSAGLNEMKKSNLPGLKALIQVAAVDVAALNEESVGFAIGPRINAAGRMTHAKEAVELFLTEDVEKAQLAALTLDKLNQNRKDTVAAITEKALEQAEGLLFNEDAVLIVAGKEWHEGVIGIVASRLVERYYRPTIVLSINEANGIAKGSARSVEGFDIFQALSSCRDLLPHFGGHPMAAGMSLPDERLSLLRQRLNEWSEQHVTPDIFQPKLAIDISCNVEEVTLDMIEMLDQMAPFGAGNPKPIVAIQNAQLSDARQIGKNKDHLKLSLKNSDAALDGIAFQMGHLNEEMTKDAPISIVGEIAINEWNGYRKPQIFVRDIKVTEWQLFDWRNERQLKDGIDRLPKDKIVTVVFSKDCGDMDNLNAVIADQLEPEDLKDRYAIFVDIPDHLDQLTRLFDADAFPERLYAVFKSNSSDYFSPLPTREQFKKVYAYLKQYQPVQQGTFDRKVSSLLGIRSSNIKFIIDVFFDLNFVKMENGLLSMSDNPEKRDLTTAETYQKRISRVDVEDLLCYSSFSSLKRWIDEKKEERTKVKEAARK